MADVAVVTGPLNVTKLGRAPDVAERAPDPARAKIAALREARDIYRAAQRSASDDWEDCRAAVDDASNRVRALTDPQIAMRHGNRPVATDHPSALQAKEVLDRAKGELQAVKDRMEARSSRANQIGALLQNNLEVYLASVDPAALSVHVDVEPERKRGETDVAAVERVRRQVAGLQADLAAVKAAPIKSEAAIAIISREIHELAEKGRPDCYGVVEHGEGVRWPKRQISTELMGLSVDSQGRPIRGVGVDTIPDTLALICWAFRDQIIAVVEAEVLASADDAAALTDEERASREAEITEALLAMERQEAALVDAAAGEVLHRVDCDPRAVLRLVGPAPSKRR